MGAIVGIDLGTTTTVAARFNAGGEPEPVTLWHGESYIHSAFYFDASNPDEPAEIGEVARDAVGIQEGAFSQYKRDVGTDRFYEAHGQSYSPVGLTTLMLKRLLLHLTVQYGEVSSLTITVPANFLNRARTQTIEAAFEAGFPAPIQVIDEPTAAALFHAHTSPTPLDGNYLVYDFGGGTLDVSIVNIVGGEIHVIRSDGVAELGGMDLDKVVFNLIQEEYRRLKGEYFSVDDSGFNTAQAERIKEQLSSSPSRTVSIFTSKHGRVNVTITQAAFVAAATPLFDKSFECIERVIRGAFMEKGEITGVFMAGGTSNIPELERRLTEFFGFAPVRRHPSQAIAMGAAVFAAYRTYAECPELLGPEQKSRIKDKALVEVCPYYLGTTAETDENVDFNSVLIRKGDPRPASVTAEYFVIDDGQDSIRCDVTQCREDTQDLEHPELTRIFDEYMPLPPDCRKGDKLLVTFTYDSNGVFKGEFLDVERGQRTEFEGNL
jgi:molecular chaperone DnaK (HSP70)